MLDDNTIVAICHNYIMPQESIGLPYGIVILRLSLQMVELHMNTFNIYEHIYLKYISTF